MDGRCRCLARATCAMRGERKGRGVEPTLGIEPRTPSLRVAPDRACDAHPASTQTPTVPQFPLFLMGMLARSLARKGLASPCILADSTRAEARCPHGWRASAQSERPGHSRSCRRSLASSVQLPHASQTVPTCSITARSPSSRFRLTRQATGPTTCASPVDGFVQPTADGGIPRWRRNKPQSTRP
jgi:hypothetical protein